MIDTEGLKKDVTKVSADKYIEEYNKLDYIDNIQNTAVLCGILSFNYGKDFLNGEIMKDPFAAIAKYSKIMTALDKNQGKALFESEEHAKERQEQAEQKDIQMKLLGILRENDPATWQAMLNGDENATKYIKDYTDNLNSIDPELYNEITQAAQEKDWDTFEQRFAQCLRNAQAYEGINQLYGINPQMYNDMQYLGYEIENNRITDVSQIPQNSDFEARLTRLENTLYTYMQMQQGIAPQTQERAGEEREVKERAVYEKDGISIKVAEELNPEKEQEELQHGQEFAQAEKEVTDEELEQAEKEVQERDAITEDGTVSIILGNSKKITITVEPYIAGDKETQMAKEANEQEQIASRESSQEMTDDTQRG